MSHSRVPFTSRTIRYGAVVFVAVGIFLGSVQDPGTATGHYYGPFGVIPRDKWAHASAYAVLTATIVYALVTTGLTSILHRLVLAVCLAVGFGICIELIQWPIPYRTASGIDAVANTIGSVLLAVVWWATRYVRYGGAGSVSD